MNTPLNQVILQAPGVAQDSYGRYTFGAITGTFSTGSMASSSRKHQRLRPGVESRFAQSISLLTGALPAQFGLRTAGVIDIKTKEGLLENRADAELYGGQRGTSNPLRVRRIVGQAQLLRDRSISQHRSRGRAAHSRRDPHRRYRQRGKRSGTCPTFSIRPRGSA